MKSHNNLRIKTVSSVYFAREMSKRVIFFQYLLLKLRVLVDKLPTHCSKVCFILCSTHNRIKMSSCQSLRLKILYCLSVIGNQHLASSVAPFGPSYPNRILEKNSGCFKVKQNYFKHYIRLNLDIQNVSTFQVQARFKLFVNTQCIL